MCIHELTCCALCPTEEYEARVRQYEAAALAEAFARVSQAPSLPTPIPVVVVPVPTTSRHEPGNGRGIVWNPVLHPIGTNPNPPFVPLQTRPNGRTERLFSRLAAARPEWLPDHA